MARPRPLSRVLIGVGSANEKALSYENIATIVKRVGAATSNAAAATGAEAVVSPLAAAFSAPAGDAAKEKVVNPEVDMEALLEKTRRRSEGLDRSLCPTRRFLVLGRRYQLLREK